MIHYVVIPTGFISTFEAMGWQKAPNQELFEHDHASTIMIEPQLTGISGDLISEGS